MLPYFLYYCTFALKIFLYNLKNKLSLKIKTKFNIMMFL